MKTVNHLYKRSTVLALITYMYSQPLHMPTVINSKQYAPQSQAPHLLSNLSWPPRRNKREIKPVRLHSFRLQLAICYASQINIRGNINGVKIANCIIKYPANPPAIQYYLYTIYTRVHAVKLLRLHWFHTVCDFFKRPRLHSHLFAQQRFDLDVKTGRTF